MKPHATKPVALFFPPIHTSHGLYTVSHCLFTLPTVRKPIRRRDHKRPLIAVGCQAVLLPAKNSNDDQADIGGPLTGAGHCATGFSCIVIRSPLLLHHCTDKEARACRSRQPQNHGLGSTLQRLTAVLNK